jgi:uncharacterized protein (DUF2126 family)/transglutaminase-like putative cysteine protease
MAIRVSIFHQTTYTYSPKTILGPQVVRLKPAPHCRSSIVGYSLKVSPEEHFINWQQDPYSNWLARLVFEKEVKLFQVTVDLVVDLSPINPFDFFMEDESEEMPVVYEETLEKDLSSYLKLCSKDGELGPKFDALAKECQFKGDIRTVIYLVDVNTKINQLLDYTLRMEPGVQTPEETLTLGKGSCRDFAWLMVQIFRKLGIAARFVSGYSIQLAADEKPLDGPAGVSHDVIDLHAWVEVYLPGAGWVGLDPTSGMFCTEGHIPLATSPDPSQASPIEGGLTPCEVGFKHKMSVTRIQEDPRVTRPFPDGEWQKVVELGDQVDERIQQQDMRLTMGGEPTFVSMDDYEAEEWNSGAVGQDKYERCLTLAKSLMPSCGAGSLLHCGQGKWYPGESLPRWAMSIYWRKDREPIWSDPNYLADPHVSLGHTQEDAKRFMVSLCEKIDVRADDIITAQEDPLYYVWKEGKLPPDISPEDNKLESIEDRERLRRVFNDGLQSPVGFVLPIQKGHDENGDTCWQSGMWLVRGKSKPLGPKAKTTTASKKYLAEQQQEASLKAKKLKEDIEAAKVADRKITLIPGDSPIGLRLPLDTLHTGTPEPFLEPTDPTDLSTPELPKRDRYQETVVSYERRQSHYSLPQSNQANANEDQLRDGLSGKHLIRTALTCQAKDGVVHFFMPPVRCLEDYLELLVAVESTSVTCDLPVVIEGYIPPVDPRIEVLKVTPDPGVIEVNVAPAHNWRELVHNTKTLYEHAKACRLGTEKFMIDGRHTGTGGGNHVVVGAATPLDSPFLRRPDLMRSVLAYWNNHPSLSYLFSGMFIGSTSQAPRVDEGRMDAIDELELAMLQFNCFDEPPAWMVDRWFRNLLTDLTGNTHRSEICMDKLYSPDSTTGRLGLIEFRGFEMPPHAEMSLVQQLLVRSILLMLWEKPFTGKLKRHGKSLHDKYLLPQCIREDFSEVLHDLQLSGIPFKESWFNSQFEFRFPIAGTVKVDKAIIEIRQAIEPWNVLGEEPVAGATARCVDSSLERLQVMVKNFDPDKWAITVNGYHLPLHHLEGDTYYIGVKFRAWQPPHCLHPAIPVHAPLQFDLVQKECMKVLGGCCYHTSHPGGANYDTRPVNALSAEARRKERFTTTSHTAGPIIIKELPERTKNLYTVDMRLASLLT